MTEKECYLCGKKASETPQGTLTRDHLPPKNLFLEPRPSNLITVPCCFACNNGFHDDDESFRAAVSLNYNANPIGKQIWKEKVVGSTIRKRRIRESIAHIRSSLKRIALITPEGVKEAYEARFERAPVDRVLTRMTKGFLAKWYAEIDRSELTFQITHLDQFKVNDPVFNAILRHLSYFQRGDGVYRCWHDIEEYSLRGFWIHMFFDSAAYVVKNTSERRIVLPAARTIHPSA